MGQTERLSRRQALRRTGGATTIALAAGCLSGAETGDEDERTDDEEPTRSTDEPDDDETKHATDEPDDDETKHATDEPDDGTAETNATEDDDRNIRAEAWTDVDESVLSAMTAGWEGVEPEPIEGEENPALVLEAGREYVLRWRNEDGQPHNIEIWDESGEVVDGYETELMDEAGATQSLEFEASAEMAEYVCKIHAGWQKRGRIEIEHP